MKKSMRGTLTYIVTFCLVFALLPVSALQLLNSVSPAIDSSEQVVDSGEIVDSGYHRRTSRKNTNDADRLAYDYWMGIREDIAYASDVATIYVEAKDYKIIPVQVLEELKDKDVTLEIDYRGDSIIIYGKKMHPIEDYRIYYNLNDLQELYETPVEEPEVPEEPEQNSAPPVKAEPPKVVGTITPASSSSSSQSEASSASSASESEPDQPAEAITQPAVVQPPKPESSIRLWMVITIASGAIAVISVIVCILSIQRQKRRF